MRDEACGVCQDDLEDEEDEEDGPSAKESTEFESSPAPEQAGLQVKQALAHADPGHGECIYTQFEKRWTAQPAMRACLSWGLLGLFAFLRESPEDKQANSRMHADISSTLPSINTTWRVDHRILDRRIPLFRNAVREKLALLD